MMYAEHEYLGFFFGLGKYGGEQFYDKIHCREIVIEDDDAVSARFAHVGADAFPCTGLFLFHIYYVIGEYVSGCRKKGNGRLAVSLRLFSANLLKKHRNIGGQPRKKKVSFGCLPKMCYLCIGYAEMPHANYAYSEK